MKKIAIAIAAILMSTALSVFADAPLGVGSADVSSSPCFLQVTVVGPGNFNPVLPGGLGVLLVEAGEQHVVLSNSAQGNVHLTCRGQLGAGSYVQGVDITTQLPAEGIVAGAPETCESFIAFGLPDACRGEGMNSVVVIDSDFQGLPCLIDGVETYDWKTVYSAGKGVSMICHGRQ
jgi:hypothetical protein